MNVMDSFSLKGKVALVTGGASKLGKQLVLALAQAGAKTYSASRNIEAQEEYAAQLKDEGYDIGTMYLDQGDAGSIMELKEEMLKKEGKVDILVNNAVLRTMNSWDDPLELFAESMKVNATGLFAITRAFGDEMAKNKQGSIINISSSMALVAAPNASAEYTFHKGGMISFTRLVASRYGPSNVRCNCISPGAFRNENTPAELYKVYSSKTMLGRMVDSTDLMGVTVFLASDASKFITGANIPVEGGYTAL